MSEFIVHYYLKDNSHAINSLTLYKSQEELFHLINEISSVFSANIKIKVLPPKEGGFVHVLEFVNDNVPALTLVSGVAASVIAGVFWVTHQRPLLNQQQNINQQQIELNKQQADKNQLDIDKAKIELERLRKEISLERLNPDEQISNERNLLLPLEESPSEDDLSTIVAGNKKVLKRISEMYKHLYADIEVMAIGFKDEARFEEIIVKRDCFEKFILENELIEDLIVPDSVIEITSPVLNEKDIQWHGVYGKKNIGFYLRDNDFKSQVLKKKINFKNGSKIICSMRMLQRINSFGDVEVYEYIAENVSVFK